MPVETVQTPAPGVFYRQPNPDDPPFVEEGDTVSAGDVIALVEVMKNFHEIEAGVDGTLEAFLVDNEAEIEAGEPIAEISTE